mmetsp:Transcript_103715/g.302713  ORF Transcript_103715/g.302713 Transcript_103715/m.302713 type:complete len:93 (-) Transcript_103715:1495-1773(-)
MGTSRHPQLNGSQVNSQVPPYTFTTWPGYPKVNRYVQSWGELNSSSSRTPIAFVTSLCRTQPMDDRSTALHMKPRQPLPGISWINRLSNATR